MTPIQLPGLTPSPMMPSSTTPTSEFITVDCPDRSILPTTHPAINRIPIVDIVDIVEKITPSQKLNSPSEFAAMSSPGYKNCSGAVKLNHRNRTSR